METRRSSSRLKNQSTGSTIVQKKRKSESPEPRDKYETKVSNNKKKRIETVSAKPSIFDDTPLEVIEDKIRHDSIEEYVSGATNVNLSSDSESDESSDGFKPKKTDGNVETNENDDKPPENEVNAVETSEYFDFSKILSKQNSFQSLLAQAKQNEHTSKSIIPSEERHIEDKDANITECTNESNARSSSAKTRKPSSKIETPKTQKSSSRTNSRNETSNSDTKKSLHKINSRKSKSKNSNEMKVRNSTDDDLNVKELLAIGEGVDTSQLTNLEEEENEIVKEDYKIPENVEITLDLPNAGKKKKKGFDLEAALKRRLNSVRKENQVFVHKVHLLCLLSHGFHLNKSLNNENLIGIALSLIPSKQCYPPKHADITYLENFMSWFCKKITIEDATQIKFNINCSNITSHLTLCFTEHKARTKIDLTLMFIAVMRSLGLKCRLMINLQPLPLKPPSEILLPVSTKPKSETSSKPKPKSEPKKEIRKNPRFENKKVKKTSTVSKYFQSSSQSESDSPSKYFKTNSKESVQKSSQNNNKGKSSSKSSKEKSNSRSSKGKSDLCSRPSCSKSNQKTECDYMTDEDSEDSDFTSPKKSKTSRKTSKASPLPKKSPSKFSSIDRKVLSSESEAESSSIRVEKKIGLDVWCEVFLEAEEKWISVDIINKRYHCVEKLFSACTHPMSYVLGWNNDNTIKDLTKRYAPQWLTNTQKLRVDAKWWRKTLKPYAPANTVWEREENEDLEQQLKDMPLPLSTSEYKNHPLYVLPKDLLKFQAIHPPDVIPVGYFKGEKVYPRSAVQELHTRETWLKEARVVRLGEKPYKIVKARLKKDKFGFLPQEEKKSELFGIWQTEDYIPPVAQDGIVPRNSFGNVDLFLESMLPIGTVHLQLPQLQRIARKLNIDCAPAMVGFEPCRFGSRPVMDGWIVCEEFRDVLLDAWNQEFDEKTKAENEKRRKRARSNWRKLVRCLRVKKRLERRYQFNLEAETSKEK